MRPIDADVVIKHIEEYWEMVKRGKPSRGMTTVMQNIKTIVNSLPTVDAVPVIRCKDCYFCGTFQRKNYCTKYEHSVKQDGFCSWAEPKETE